MRKASEDSYEKFYQNLAHLFYAVAMADGIIRKEEKHMLHRMVKEEWLNPDGSTDEYGTDAAYEIETVFDLLEVHNITSEQAFAGFENYYHANSDLFDEAVTGKIIHTAHRIASSFHQKNKSEHTVLTKIHFMLGHANAAH